MPVVLLTLDANSSKALAAIDATNKTLAAMDAVVKKVAQSSLSMADTVVAAMARVDGSVGTTRAAVLDLAPAYAAVATAAQDSSLKQVVAFTAVRDAARDATVAIDAQIASLARLASASVSGGGVGTASRSVAGLPSTGAPLAAGVGTSAIDAANAAMLTLDATIARVDASALALDATIATAMKSARASIDGATATSYGLDSAFADLGIASEDSAARQVTAFGTVRDAAALTTTAIREQTLALADLATMSRLASTGAMGVPSGGSVARTAEAVVAERAALGMAGRNIVGGVAEQFGVPGRFGMAAAMFGMPAIATLGAGFVGYKAMHASNQFQSSLAQLGSETGNTFAGVQPIGNASLNYGGSGTAQYSPSQMNAGAQPFLAAQIPPSIYAGLEKLIGTGSAALGQKDTNVLTQGSTDLIDAFYGGKNVSADNARTATEMAFAADTFAKSNPGALVQNMSKILPTAQLAGVSAPEALAYTIKETLSGESARFSATNFAALVANVSLRAQPTPNQEKAATGLDVLIGPKAIQTYGSFTNWLQAVYKGAATDPNRAADLYQLTGSRNAFRGIGELFQGGGIAQYQSTIERLTGSGTAGGGAIEAAGTTLMAGPDAQWKGVFNQFQTELIDTGKVLTTQLQPAMITAAKDIAHSTKDLGDALGAGGHALDTFVAWVKTLHIPQVGSPGGNALPGDNLNTPGGGSAPFLNLDKVGSALGALPGILSTVPGVFGTGAGMFFSALGGAVHRALPAGGNSAHAAGMPHGTLPDTWFNQTPTYVPGAATVTQPSAMPPFVNPMAFYQGRTSAETANAGAIGSADAGAARLATVHAQHIALLQLQPDFAAASKAHDELVNKMAAGLPFDNINKQLGVYEALLKQLQADIAVLPSGTLTGTGISRTTIGKEGTTTSNLVGKYEYTTARQQLNMDIPAYEQGALSLGDLRKDLAAVHAALKTSGDSAAQQKYLGYSADQAFGKAVGVVQRSDNLVAAQMMAQAAQDNITAARMMGATPDQLKVLNDQYFADLRTVDRETYSKPSQAPQLAAALRGVNQQQNVSDYQTHAADLTIALRQLQDQLKIDQATGNIPGMTRDQVAINAFTAAHGAQMTPGYTPLDQAAAAAGQPHPELTRREQDLQNQLRLDSNAGNIPAERKDQAAILDFYKQFGAQLKPGFNASDLAVMASDFAKALQATPLAPPPAFRQNQPGVGALEAGNFSTAVRFGGGKDPQLEEIRQLRQALQQANQRNEQLLSQIARNTTPGRQAARTNQITQAGGNYSAAP